MMYKSIQALLLDNLKDITGLPTVVAENTSFKPTLQQKYIRTYLLPATATRISISSVGQYRFPGVFQISLSLPSNTGVAYDLIDQIIEQFKNKILVTDDDKVRVVIISANTNPAIIERDWYTVPISISFEAFAETENIYIEPTVTPSPTVTPTISVTPSVTPTISFTPSITPSVSVSASLPAVSPTPTPTVTVTPSSTPTGPAFIVRDTFTEASYPVDILSHNPEIYPSSGWEEFGTAFYRVISPGRVEQQFGVSGGMIIESGVHDCTISADFWQNAGGGIICRYLNSNNYYRVAIEVTGITIYKIQGGNVTQIGNDIGHTLTYPSKLTVVLNGNNISATFGPSSVSVTDSHNSSQTKHGLLMFQESDIADNFEII